MRSTPAAHDVVDLSRWVAHFPLERRWEEIHAQNGPEFWYYAPSDVFSPRDLAWTEQLRARAGFQRSADATPVDVLLPAWGEPERPFVSKVGGVPYLRRGEWPSAADGSPLLFLAQFCLADSRDVLGAVRLPADVLVIFYEDGDDMIESSSSGTRVHFEWRNVDIPKNELIGADEVPKESVRTPTHFQRFRSFETGETRGIDHPRAKIAVSGRYSASKIGGLPAYVQDEQEAVGLGTHLASLHSINPGDRVYPFPNLPEAVWRETWDAGFLMLGDVGTLYLYLTNEGDVNWLMQSC